MRERSERYSTKTDERRDRGREGEGEREVGRGEVSVEVNRERDGRTGEAATDNHRRHENGVCAWRERERL